MRGRACGVYLSCTQPVLATTAHPFEYRIWTTPGAVEVVRSAHALRLPTRCVRARLRRPAQKHHPRRHPQGG
eukprot:5391734-Prymnesium_polylepis.1